VSSVEVEAVMYAHPAVREAAVMGWPDEFWGGDVVRVCGAEGVVGAAADGRGGGGVLQRKDGALHGAEDGGVQGGAAEDADGEDSEARAEEGGSGYGVLGYAESPRFGRLSGTRWGETGGWGLLAGEGGSSRWWEGTTRRSFGLSVPKIVLKERWIQSTSKINTEPNKSWVVLTRFTSLCYTSPYMSNNNKALLFLCSICGTGFHSGAPCIEPLATLRVLLNLVEGLHESTAIPFQKKGLRVSKNACSAA